MNLCDGTERHRHFRFSSNSYITHEHFHHKRENSFNALHHHASVEHDDFTTEELEKGMIDTGIKLGEV